MPVNTDDHFERYQTDPHNNGIHHLASTFRESGLATFDGITDRAVFADLMHDLAVLCPHPDNGPDGLTLLHAREGDPEAGQRGFTDFELLPHTERSSLQTPPQLLMLLCLSPADRGGESVLIDGQAVAEDLVRAAPETWSVLSTPRTAYFGGSAGYLGAIFESAGPERWTIRLRIDELIRFAPEVLPHVGILREVIGRHTTLLRLDKGQGFILDNTRRLHGRRSFSGSRVMLRALGEPRTPLPLERGFQLF